MTIWNLGSINADYIYALPHLPAPGETLAARTLTTGLGGKGANMSVGCARAGGKTEHIGALGPEGAWMADRLRSYGVGTTHIATLDAPSGHAIIAVEDGGENLILVFPGTNRQIPPAHIEAALAQAAPGDWFLTQNETNHQLEAARLAKARGLRVGYAAAPFDPAAVQAMLPHADFLILNEVEADQLRDATGTPLGELGVADVIVTLGAEGCLWFHDGREESFPALRVTPVDTTGAGDTFTGYILAALDEGMPMPDAIRLATRASALKVTRHGAADAVPTRAEAEAFEGEAHA
ncbi:Ribokinase [Rubellimicrobium mesophilum DSM 19309]|uniref:Ribokinase n=1 Tax=Rubellimicrobium mesophilum DSM 19309 TaxID=442562 RepID=A0A017HIG3_9RHOB|nr:ribokinase [Rubellimicrobium mesophilum]EYD74141.1 Ribokinase [Rubellimicrobium mesophilum DSM 19309]